MHFEMTVGSRGQMANADLRKLKYSVNLIFAVSFESMIVRTNFSLKRKFSALKAFCVFLLDNLRITQQIHHENVALSSFAAYN